MSSPFRIGEPYPRSATISLQMRMPVSLLKLLVLSAIPWQPSPAAKPAQHVPELLVVNQADHSVSFINPVSSQPLATFDEAAVTGHEIAVTPNGRTAFVPIYGSS